ncbi:DMT family transporter [Castellaniella sp. GW247-6E4]|uniref:DMT family transporter n=1 Tax=Castellaniella sp. GW247-6E4 TaxID=3140380 RepID=UPI0033150CE8
MDIQGDARPWLGPVLMCLAGLCFAMLDSATKYLAAFYPLTQIVWGRYAAQTLLLALVFAPRMGWSLFHAHSYPLQLLRGLCLFSASILVINGFARLPLTETSAILFLAPLIVTLLSGALLKEKARRMDWVAVCCGFAGVLIIARPGGGLLTWAILFPVGAAVCNALYQIVTRSTRSSEHPVTSNLYTGMVGTALLLPVMPAVWMPMLWTDLLLVGGSGCIAAVGHLVITKALSYSPAAALGPYSYFQLVFVAALSWMIFGTLPDAVSWIGILVIATGGLMISVRRLLQYGSSKFHSRKRLR